MGVFAAVGLLTIVLSGGAMLVSMQQLASSQKHLQQHPHTVSLAIKDIRTQIAVIQRELTALADAPSRLSLRRFQRRVDIASNSINERMALVSERFQGDQSILDTTIAEFQGWAPIEDRLISAVLENDPTAAYTLAKTAGAGQITQIVSSLDVLAGSVREQAEQINRRVGRLWETTLLIEAATFLITFVMVLACLRFVWQAVVGPTRDIGNALERIASGDLTAEIPHTDREDEVGDIARASQVFLSTAVAIRESHFDLLTGLPARKQLCEHLDALRAQDKLSQQTTAIMRLDLDRFSELNETYGRDACDEMLAETAATLRKLTIIGEYIARDGADNFVLVLVGTADPEVLQARAEALRNGIGEIRSDVDPALVLTCSIGIMVCDDRTSTDQLLINAENALNDARKAGFGGISIYTAEMDARLRRRRETFRGLKFALAKGEIVPFFQPQISATTGALTGFEALVRWNHPEQGVLSPWQFIDVAQSAGLMGDITETMVAKTVDQLAAWRGLGFMVPRVSLNFTGGDLRRPDFVDRLMLEIDRAGLEPANICVELLESTMIDHVDDPVTKTLERLSTLGFPIELDDFGTGHAAIATLHLVKLNGLKIDRSFITNLHRKPDRQHLTRGILRIARALNITSVAEGVECAEERAFLADMGCDTIQGYLIARPMSAHDATIWQERYEPEIFGSDLKQSA